MRKEEFGIVVEINGEMAKVKATRHGDCENCGSCPGDNAITLDVKNPLSAKLGQKVAFEIPQTNMLQAAFVVYVLPLIAAAAGVIVGSLIANQFGQPLVLFQIIGGIVAFILSLFFVKIYDRYVKSNKNMLPVITKILS